MSRVLKAAVLAAMAGSCGALLVGCETFDNGQPSLQVQTAADDALPVSRARVVAELKEAQRLGLITVGEEDIPQYSAEQSRLIAQAGAAAQDPTTAKK